MMEMNRRELIGKAILIGGGVAFSLEVMPDRNGWDRVVELRQAGEWEDANQLVHQIWEREARLRAER